MDWAELDLSPPYPTVVSLLPQLANKAFTSDQRRSLVKHALGRANLFADLPLLTFILQHPLSKDLVDLTAQDEDGLNIISQSIVCFGEESDRNVDREECIRLLIVHGVSIETPDNIGWTPLHHAALFAPPTLVAYLVTHGASPLATSHKSLTPLDIITSYQPIPNRQDVALVLQDAMQERGWDGSPLEIRRLRRNRQREAKRVQTDKRVGEWDRIGRVLGMRHRWWGSVEDEFNFEDEDDRPSLENEEDVEDDVTPDNVYTPPRDYTSMLVFSLSSLPSILQSIIVEAEPVLHPIARRSAPANAIYLLARFACLECDISWFDALLTSSVDRIEEVVYARPDKQEDMAHLAFWLYNSTLLLHLLRCDRDLYDMCDALDLFSLMEELVNAIYVFIIRGTERRIDALIDAALLDHSPLASEFESIQFESDWAFLRSLTPKRKHVSTNSQSNPSSLSSAYDHSSPASTVKSSFATMRPSSPSSSPSASVFNSFKQTVARSSHPSLSSVFPPNSPSSKPQLTTITPSAITSILSSVYSLLTIFDLNPAIIIQAHTQVMYWISCETFNRILTRRKYLCRSRAVQIGLNLSILEEWVGSVGLPSGVCAHFQSVRELLTWLQCHSSIDQFMALVDTIQTMRSLNPLQMRRAVRDYRYEVMEGRMTEECVQYLAQLQKDWERRRVKLGVEALRKEIGERNRDRADSVTSGSGLSGNTFDTSSHSLSIPDDAPSETQSMASWSASRRTETQQAVDGLFDRNRLKNEWTAPSPPEVLGELLDSTYMLPISLPSDPELLATWSGPSVEYIIEQEGKLRKRQSEDLSPGEGIRSASRASVGNRGEMQWRLRSQTMRAVLPELVDWVDGGVRVRPPEMEDMDDGDDERNADREEQDRLDAMPPSDAFTSPALFQRRQARVSRASTGADTVVPSSNGRESLTPERPRTRNVVTA